MTERAYNLAQTIEEVSWDWENMQPSHPHTIAVATLREMVKELKYIGITEKNILELANELEAL
jgi:DNA-binding transcriptional regulator YhcF (GntR family)